MRRNPYVAMSDLTSKVLELNSERGELNRNVAKHTTKESKIPATWGLREIKEQERQQEEADTIKRKVLAQVMPQIDSVKNATRELKTMMAKFVVMDEDEDKDENSEPEDSFNFASVFGLCKLPVFGQPKFTCN